jgi:hypothetical protein
MGEVVNLRSARKQAARKAARAAADANAARHGLTKAERNRQATEANEAARKLDGHRRETDAPSDG